MGTGCPGVRVGIKVSTAGIHNDGHTRKVQGLYPWQLVGLQVMQNGQTQAIIVQPEAIPHPTNQ